MSTILDSRNILGRFQCCQVQIVDDIHLLRSDGSQISTGIFSKIDNTNLIQKDLAAPIGCLAFFQDSQLTDPEFGKGVRTGSHRVFG